MSPAAGGAGPVILLDAPGPDPDAPARLRVEVRAGEIALLAGPSGSGKSAILAWAAGRRSRCGGRALVGGHSLASLAARQRRRAVRALRLLYLPPDPPLISNLTVLENILLPIHHFGGPGAADAVPRALAALERCGIARAARWLPANLSPGGRKLVSMIRGFLRNPVAAILDEPLADLDETEIEGILPGIRAARDGGCAILAAARERDPYEGLAWRIIEIDGGEIGRSFPGGEAS